MTTNITAKEHALFTKSQKFYKKLAAFADELEYRSTTKSELKIDPNSKNKDMDRIWVSLEDTFSSLDKPIRYWGSDCIYKRNRRGIVR
jgi:hypothetical protein